MNWTIVFELGMILIYVQVILMIVSIILMFSFFFLIVLPDAGGIMAWITMDREEEAEKAKKKYYSHPLRVWQRAICPFAWWWWDAIEFVLRYARKD